MNKTLTLAAATGIVLALAFSLGAIPSGIDAQAQTEPTPFPSREKTLSVTGSATTSVDPDLLNVQFGVEVQKETAKEAFDANSQQMNAVVDAIKAVGELLSSDSSRTILKLLFNDQMTANQIAQKTEISLPLVIYHLKKMQEAGLVKIAQVEKNTKSHDMKVYTVDKFAIVILPSGMTEKAKSSKSLHNSFNRIYRFATIGGAAIAAWFSSQFMQQTQQATIQDNAAQTEMMMKGASETAQRAMDAPAPPAEMMPYAASSPTTGEPSVDIYISIIITLGVIVIGLIIERILRARRKD